MLHQFGAFSATNQSPRKEAANSRTSQSRYATPPRRGHTTESNEDDDYSDDTDEVDEDKENRGVEYIDVDAVEDVSHRNSA